jgi:hypothetical protein
MVEQKKKDTLKNIIINLGVMLVLVGATAAREQNLTLFFMGLVLLILHIFDFKGVAATKLIMAEIILSVTLGVDAITQLFTARSFSAPQSFLVVLLLGVILIIVDSVREFAELE